MISESALPRRDRGFTLLEMLVVMVIAGMALLLTTQALGQYQRAHTRAIASERNGREQRMSEAWFRASVRSLQASAPATPAAAADATAPVFSGDALGFEGVTLAPVFEEQGTPIAQRWRIVSDAAGDHLELVEGDNELRLSLPRADRLRLHYLDPEGALHDAWPPSTGVAQQLPAAIVLEMTSSAAGASQLVAAAVLGPRDPMRIPYEDAPE